MNELLAYNISVHVQNTLEFFGREPGPIDHLDSHLPSTIDRLIATNFPKETYCFLSYLDLALCDNSDQEVPSMTFGRSMLKVMGLDEVGTVIHSHFSIPFAICGNPGRAANMDICLVHLNSMILLVIQEDKMTEHVCA